MTWYGRENTPISSMSEYFTIYQWGTKKQLYSPIWFKTADWWGERKGFKATLLPDICDVWLKARDAGVLVRNQSQTAKMADILIRWLSRIGIIALVDEATGYQKRKDEYQKTQEMTRI